MRFVCIFVQNHISRVPSGLSNLDVSTSSLEHPVKTASTLTATILASLEELDTLLQAGSSSENWQSLLQAQASMQQVTERLPGVENLLKEKVRFSITPDARQMIIQMANLFQDEGI